MQSKSYSPNTTTATSATVFSYQQTQKNQHQPDQFQQRLVSPNYQSNQSRNTAALPPNQKHSNPPTPFYSGFSSSGSVGAFVGNRGGGVGGGVGLDGDDVLNDLPDLSHLSEEERKIIEAVLERQRIEEAKNNASLSSSRSSTNQNINNLSSKSNTLPLNNSSFFNNPQNNNNNNNSRTFSNHEKFKKNINTSTESFLNHNQPSNKQKERDKQLGEQNFLRKGSERHSINDIAQEVKQRYGSIDTGNVCDLCKKTKFSNGGVGHVCFNCKARCCVRCAFRYTTKAKQLWACVECKKKQDAFLKSDQWLNSPVLNKKNFTSDYILNKGAFKIVNCNFNMNPQIDPNETKETSSETKKRILPKLNKNLKQNSVDQLEMSEKFRMASNTTQLIKELSEESIKLKQFENPITGAGSTSSSIIRKSLKQPLIKQASLNNPPTYFQHTDNGFFQDESAMYENSTSNQDLKNSTSFQKKNVQAPISRTHNSRNSLHKERLQDPMLLFKNRNSSSNRLNISNYDLNDIDTDESTLYNREKSLNTIARSQSKETKAIGITNRELNSSNELSNPQLINHRNNNFNTISNTNQTAINQSLIKQRQNEFLHTDSLSSDPSDIQANNSKTLDNAYEYNSSNTDNNTNDESIMSRRLSNKSKNSTNVRKQPTIPINSNLALHQQRLLAKLNLKQHNSLTSSDENLNDDLDSTREASNNNTEININEQEEQQTDYLEEEDDDGIEDEVDEEGEEAEEEEEAEEQEENVEEICSTEEYTTNDEMDLESISISANANREINIKNAQQSITLNEIKKRMEMTNINNNDFNSKKSIDDYLMQNLEKDEILAAKMSKFLSPTNWQLSSDGKKIIGHIILKRNMSASNGNNSNANKKTFNPSIVNSSSSSTIDSSIDFNPSQTFGLKIVGGRINPLTNQLSAYVVKIKKDSISDTVGRLQVGDEVITWNGKSMRGLSYDQVYSILNKSKEDMTVELTVERPIDNVEREKLIKLIKSTPVEKLKDFTTTNQFIKANEVESNKPIGKFQLKIFHDSVENKLFLNVLNISIHQACSEYGYKGSESNFDKIVLKLHLNQKNTGSELYNKVSEVCNLDEKSSLFIVNEAFIFDFVNEADLTEINAEIDIINHWNSQLYGKATIDFSSEMFDNQIINLDIYSMMNGNNRDLNEAGSQKLRPSHGLSVESINSGSNNSKRRQLPQIPLEKQQQNRQKIAMDLVEKARKIKQEMQPADHHSASDNEQTKMAQFNKIPNSTSRGMSGVSDDQAQFQQNHVNEKLNPNKNVNNNESSLFLKNESCPTNNKFSNPPKNLKNHNNQLLHEESQSSLSEPSANEYSFNKNTKIMANSHKNTNTQNHNENKNDIYSSSEFLNGINSRKSSNNPSTMQNQVSNKNKNFNDNYELYQKALSRSPSPKSHGSREKKPFQTLSSPQLWKIDQDLGTHNNDIQSMLIKNLNHHHNNNKNKNVPPQNVLSTSSQSVNDNDDLFLKSNRNISSNVSSHKPSNNYLNNNNNNNNNNIENSQRASSLVQSPSETFGTIFQPISHTHTSPHNRSLPNSVINNIGFNNTSSSRPERLYSGSHLLSQRVNAISSPKVEMEPEFTNLVKHKKESNSRNDGAADSDGGASENSQLSNASKLSSTSLKSAQSEFTKGANNIINNNKKGISGLTQSDTNRYTTVATNASTTTTTTTLINNNSTMLKGDVNANTNSHAAGIISEKNDGTMSDSALTNPTTTAPDNPANKKRRPSMAKALVILGLSKKSNSASNLAYGKRFGFARSEEYGVVAPELRNRTLSATASGESSGNEDRTPKPTLWSGALKLPHELPFSEFVERLGPGQKVSRQVLGLPCLGEIKMVLFTEKQKLSVEIVEAKNLKQKTSYKFLPSVYVKLYLFRGSSCIEKQKTTCKRRTLNPTYAETLKFEADYKGSVLQVTIWGDYGKLDRKIFMGIAQIVLDDIKVSGQVVGNYKLFNITSIITDFSTIASTNDLSQAESAYSIGSRKSAVQKIK